MTNFINISYMLHADHYKLADNGELSEAQLQWLRQDTVDFWRHYRMCAPVIPFAKFNPGSSWMTIGDGRLGLDSIRLKSFEDSITVLPTDISTLLLEQAKRIGLIENFGNENAENISSDDGSFDYSFCKESFHHFPRPYIALYEMIRVSRKAVILIEPADDDKNPLPLSIIRNIKLLVKKIVGKPIRHNDFFRFETSGNYVYTISSRDIEKVAAGLQLPMIAFKYFNDYYEDGVEISPANNSSKLFKRVKSKIKFRNLMCRLGLATYTGMIAVIFKENPSTELLRALQTEGFTITEIPTNPYLN
jgi:ubiquinone/menaquinone biosynthesis C-methylase UbiE